MTQKGQVESVQSGSNKAKSVARPQATAFFKVESGVPECGGHRMIDGTLRLHAKAAVDMNWRDAAVAAFHEIAWEFFVPGQQHISTEISCALERTYRISSLYAHLEVGQYLEEIGRRINYIVASAMVEPESARLPKLRAALDDLVRSSLAR